MAYLDLKPVGTIAAHIRRFFSNVTEDVRSREVEELSGQRRIFTDIGEFIFRNQLDPTPHHYDLAYQYHALPHTVLAKAVQAEVETHGVLGADAAERILVECAGLVTAESLADYASNISVQMEGLSQIVLQTGRDTKQFRQKIETSGGKDKQEAIMNLCADMILRTGVAEARLRNASKEIAELRDAVADAQRVADIDPLTEVLNRRAFKRDLSRAIGHSHATGSPLSLAFCDIDNFKSINDQHGHEVGDRVIRYVASKLVDQLSHQGVVGRIGGDEFVIMLSGSALQKAQTTLDNCRIKIASRTLATRTENQTVGSITFSAGITDIRDADGPAEMLARADAALYRAKAAGKTVSGLDKLRVALCHGRRNMLPFAARCRRSIKSSQIARASCRRQ